MQSDVKELSDAVHAVIGPVREFRHALHAYPEIGLKEFKTSEAVSRKLSDAGCDSVTEGVGGTGVVALIYGKRPGKHTVAFRADMDALPMTEATGCPWTSRTAGLMHGCGHDGHTAWAVAVASALCATRDFAGTAMIIIQPGEEGWAGARKMIEDGLFARWNVDEVYAGHCAPELKAGQFGLTPGLMTSAAALFHIDVTGVGCHGARPHTGRDSVVAASELVLALQTVVSRSIDPMRPAALTVASIHGGNENGVSVIPDSVRVSGTTRCLFPGDCDTIEERMNAICQGVSMTTGCAVKLTYVRMYPPLKNAEPQRQAAGAVLRELVGEENVDMNNPASMGAEDFSFMCNEKPGVYIRVGVRDADHTANLHNPHYDFNDAVLEKTAVAFSLLIKRRLDALEGCSQ